MKTMWQTLGDIGMSVSAVICLGMTIFSFFRYSPVVIVGLLLVGILSGGCLVLYQTRKNKIFWFLSLLGWAPAYIMITQVYPSALSKDSDVVSVVAGMCLVLTAFATSFTILHNQEKTRA